MGVVSESDVRATLGAIEKGLTKSGYASVPGEGLAAAQKALIVA
jgi:aspartate aminotransferase-like enzyme